MAGVNAASLPAGLHAARDVVVQNLHFRPAEW
jgi:hypothetical protein